MAPVAPDAGPATNGAAVTLPAGITVAEAADRAGISRVAARKRLRRGSWRAWKLDGEWRVDPASVEAVSGEVVEAGPPAGRPAERATAPPAGPPAARPAETDGPLLEALRDEVVYLRRKLDERDEELRRQTVTIAQLVARLPQLPAPASGGQGEAPPATTPPDADGETPSPPPPGTPRHRPGWWGRLTDWLVGA
jgi:hypothetical protein